MVRHFVTYVFLGILLLGYGSFIEASSKDNLEQVSSFERSMREEIEWSSSFFRTKLPFDLRIRRQSINWFFLNQQKDITKLGVGPLRGLLGEAEEESDESLRDDVEKTLKDMSKQLPHSEAKPTKDNKVVYLTFDDGPSRNTKRILDILTEHQIRGTFFVVGTSLNGRNDSATLLQRMLEEGHYIGLHSMTHRADLLYKGSNAPQLFLDEMLEVQQVVKELTHHFESQLFRAPYGTYPTFSDEHLRLMVESPLKGWDWNVDTNDWRAQSVDEVMENIEASLSLIQTPNRLVVLFHEHDITVEALPRVIEFFREKEFTFLPYDPNDHFPMNLLKSPDL